MGTRGFRGARALARFGAVAILIASTVPCQAAGDGEEQADGAGGPDAGVALSAAAGKGVTISAGDAFSLSMLNTIQPGWIHTDFSSQSDLDTFAIVRARTGIAGHVWDSSKTYLVQFDWARNNVLFDAWLNWDFVDAGPTDRVGLRVGQQKPHHGREFQGSFAGLENTTFSGLTQVFTGFRVTGAYLHGDHLPGRKLHWWLGAANGDPAFASSAAEGGRNGAPNVDDELNYFFDARFDPAGDFGDEKYAEADLAHSPELSGTVGGSGMLANLRAGTATGPEVATTSWVAYTAWRYRGFHVLGEVFGRRDDQDNGPTADSLGWQVGGSYTFGMPEAGRSQWGLAARVSQVELLDGPVLITRSALGSQAGEITEFDGTLSYYIHGHTAKVQLGYRHRVLDPDAAMASHAELVDLLCTIRF